MRFSKLRLLFVQRIVLITILGVSLAVLVAGILPSQSRAEIKNDGIDFNAIDAYISGKMRASRIPGLALAIVKGDQIVYLKGYGKADASGRPVTAQTPFVIGSVSKTFTALAIMQLVESGKIDLDAPVQRYLPWFRVADAKASAQITVRQMLNMTSGISANGNIATFTWSDADELALERHARFLANVDIVSPPGHSFVYSNGNYIALGALVQQSSGVSYEDYVKQHIFAPLQMRNSFVSQDEAMQDGMAVGHHWWFGIPVAVTFPYNRGDLPAGFIISSAEDMGHFLIAQMNGGQYGGQPVLSPVGLAMMQSDADAKSYHMGWESVENNGRTLLNHDGGTANFQSSLFIDPKARVGVFMAANIISALDAFSSPSGSSGLDGPSTRAMAESVLSLATAQPLPDQGPGNLRLTVMFDLVILALSILLTVALVRMPARTQRLAKVGISHRSEWMWRSGVVALLHFGWPLALLYFMQTPTWKVFVMFQPDLGVWLELVAVIVVLKGVVEMVLIWRLLHQAPQREILQPA